jgi:ribosomal protein S12 methylthiotransferase accessory factor
VRLRARAPKLPGSTAQRECSAEQTLQRVRPHLHRIGIAELVDLSALGIPVYRADAPGAIDGVTSYGGKGATLADAQASAVMEAFERHAGWLPLRPTVIASYAELTTAGRAAIHPGAHNLMLRPEYDDDRPIYWVAGHDLLADEPVLVPHGAVCFGEPAGAPPCYEVSTTNGLASGNTLEEAICHGLCEVVERDALTLWEVVGDRLGELLGGAPVPGFPLLDPGTVPARARPLVDRFGAAGLSLRLRSITSDLGIPSILASVGGHVGFGTHPDRDVALVRAITECAQGHAFDPSAADLSTTDETGPLTPVGDLATYPSDDLMADVRFMLDRLRACGLPRVVAVDLSPPEIPVCVVRVVVPGLESWAIDRSRIGTRATDAWNAAVLAHSP